jgi:small subunit ribosomal protein S20
MVRTYLKKVRAAIDTKNYDEAQTALTAAAPFVDKMVTKGIMHKNKAARVKSRLNAAVVALKG